MRKQDEIARALAEAIRSGAHPVGSRMPSQAELAEQFSTSPITVNKAVSSLVAQGYLARAASTRAGTVVKSSRPFPQGYIAFIVCFGFGTAMLKGALRAAERRNYMLVPFLREMEYDQEGCLRRLRAGQFCGMLTTSRELFDTELPAVYMDTCYHESHPEIYEVRSDTRKGGRLVAERLLSEGRREIAYCQFFPESEASRPRREGFLSGLAEGGVAAGRRLFFGRDAQPHAAKNLLREILRIHPKLDALACWNDYEARAMVLAGQELGVDIGGKIAIAGFGNLDSVQWLKPFLTVEQFPEETGYRACGKLIDLLENPGVASPHLEELEVELRH
jgi:DNA-binding LacI/PurR family transcriptional regulator